MQFGRFHGIALLTLGALLLIVQMVVIFNEKAPSTGTTASSQQPPATEPGRRPLPGLSYLSGVIGVVLAGAGATVLAQASRRGAQKRLEEERQEEDRSSGPRGHHVSTPTIWKER
jgi:tetrahydromethanopterin S-methyltransferase subunit D